MGLRSVTSAIWSVTALTGRREALPIPDEPPDDIPVHPLTMADLNN